MTTLVTSRILLKRLDSHDTIQNSCKQTLKFMDALKLIVKSLEDFRYDGGGDFWRFLI